MLKLVLDGNECIYILRLIVNSIYNVANFLVTLYSKFFKINFLIIDAKSKKIIKQYYM